MEKKLLSGLYEKVITKGDQEAIDGDRSVLAYRKNLKDHIGARLLSHHLYQLIQRAFEGQSEKDRIELTNLIIQVLNENTKDGVMSPSDFVTESRLEEIVRGVQAIKGKQTRRPGISLSQSKLLTNSNGDYRIGHELKREIESANQIDLLISFIKMTGFRLLRESLANFIGRGGTLRVITTTYMKVTEREPLDELIRMGSEDKVKVKVSFDTNRTRLHAKAWYIRRNTGFSTAFVGSSNLSASAQVDGREWNVRLSQVDAGQIIDRIRSLFNDYWDDPEFETYDGSPKSQKLFDEAVRDKSPSGKLLSLDVHPYPFQQEILNRLKVEREVHHRTQSLVVAATGTGKTVIAALDYRRLASKHQPLSLLFIAHRQEILLQARSTFQAVLKNGNFGECYVGGSHPSKWDHVFASVQSLNNFPLEEIDPEHYGMIIVDEFHHAAAKTYQRFLDYFKPQYLLGLTATPERADGQDVMSWFGDRIAAELRVWEAIDRGLLVPFHYFGLHDGGDLSSVPWVRGKYDEAELSRIFTADDMRVNKILSAVNLHIANPLKMRALGFCVSIAHAEFMARKFNSAGIPALSITGMTPNEERRKAQNQLINRDINILFSVDVLGEGVDIPPVDTILMLRPTSSATVFLQQLGRGLRHAENKECLTVMDFISNSAREFRFDYTLGAMLGEDKRQAIKEAVENEFPALPSGCHLQLDQESHKIILKNLKSQLRYSSNQLGLILQQLGDLVDLKTFLNKAELSIQEFYSKRSRTFSSLCRRAGIAIPPEGPNEEKIRRNLRLLIHADDLSRLNFLRQLAMGHLSMTELSERDRRRLLMVTGILVGPEAAKDLSGAYQYILDHPAICKELISIADLLSEKIALVPPEYSVDPKVPLELYGTYSRAEIAGAFNFVGKGRLQLLREGVSLDPLKRFHILFVTLHKSKEDYKESTRYRDYPIDSHHFHWQSQNQTKPESKVGQQHINHQTLGITPLLFLRAAKKTSLGLTMPFKFLGPVSYESHEGEKPMNIIWEMKYPIPANIIRTARLAA